MLNSVTCHTHTVKRPF